MDNNIKLNILRQGSSIDPIGKLPSPPSILALQRSHSLEFTNANHRDDLAIDLHATAELIEFFDINEFMEAVSSVGSTSTSTPKMSCDGSGSDGSDEMVGESGPDASILSTDGKRKKTKRARRITSKEHIFKLREIAKQLTKQLDALKAETQPGMQSSTKMGRRLIRSSGGSLWMQAALRQRERRRKAEEDNDSLREMLQIQIEEATCLKRILKRRSKIKLMEDMLGFPSTTTPCMSSTLVPDNNSLIIQQILHDCDELYVGVDKTFSENGMGTVPCPGQKRRVNRNVVNGSFLDLMVRSRVPFNFRNTVKAVWVYLSEMVRRGQKTAINFRKQVDNHVQHSEESGDTMASSFFAALSFVEDIRGAQLRKVTRKYIEENRGVFICRTFLEPKLQGTSESTGFQFCTTLKIVVEEDTLPTPFSGIDSCQIRIHFDASRRDLCMPNSARFRGAAHLDFGISVWDALISRIPDEIETFLIDDTRRQMDC